VLARTPGALEQAVLEHERRHDLGPGDVEQVEQRMAVDVLLEEREGGVALALRLAARRPRVCVIARAVVVGARGWCG
jgi:hypothetical protein